MEMNPAVRRPSEPPLMHIQLEVVNRCNYRCPLCKTHRQDWVQRRCMDVEEVRRVVAPVRSSLATVTLYGTRGEPLLHPGLADIVAGIKRWTGAVVVISTNGSLLNARRSEALLSAGLDKIIFAVDGISEQTYAGYRKGGSLSRVADNLETFCRLKRRMGCRTRVVLQFIPMATNESDIPHLAAWGYGRGVDIVRLKLSTSVRRDPGYRTHDLRFRIEDDRSSAFACPYGDQKLYIDPNGHCYPCCYAEGHQTLLLGNVLEKSLTAIWHGKPMRTLRKSFRSSQQLNPFCRATCWERRRRREKRVLPIPETLAPKGATIPDKDNLAEAQ
jgi:radical SAM protein with 4Fe4S-binding SPASM domain